MTLMFRVVIDTNVAVSALITPHGNAAKILDLIADNKLKVCYSELIQAEYIRVLSRPRFNFSAEDQGYFIKGIRRFGMSIEPMVSTIPFRDESDRIFYDVAKFCNATLITGNIRHYPTEPNIVTPAEFLRLLEER